MQLVWGAKCGVRDRELGEPAMRTDAVAVGKDTVPHRPACDVLVDGHDVVRHIEPGTARCAALRGRPSRARRWRQRGLSPQASTRLSRSCPCACGTGRVCMSSGLSVSCVSSRVWSPAVRSSWLRRAAVARVGIDGEAADPSRVRARGVKRMNPCCGPVPSRRRVRPMSQTAGLSRLGFRRQGLRSGG